LLRAGKGTAFLGLVLSLLLQWGCGYELVRDRGMSAGGDVEVSSIAVPVFKNKTFEPQVPAFFTEAFSRELATGGLVQINKSGAEATLLGTIEMLVTTSSSLSGAGLAVEKVVTTTVSLRLMKDGNTLRTWSFGDSEAYVVTDINVEDFNRRAALQRIAARVARRFHSQLAPGRYP
jgi:hypothetical protein